MMVHNGLKIRWKKFRAGSGLAARTTSIDEKVKNVMAIPKFMAAVQLLGHGGYEKQAYSETVATPAAGPNEVLIRVLAAGINNTDINTRIGWYSQELSASTAAANTSETSPTDGGWTGAGLKFPRIQGADVCGEIVSVGEGVSRKRIGERVIVQSCLRSLSLGSFTPWLGSERDGAFAQFVTVPSADCYHVQCDFTDGELAAIPCAFGTAENLISRLGLARGERVLITGASGNVGIAAIQLAKRRGADVIAIAAGNKSAALKTIGAKSCLERGVPMVAALGSGSIDAVIDVVGGPQWPELLDVLKPRGRYAVSGAIAGPIVQTDLRKVYLKDLTLYGCTTQDASIFPNLIGYIERGEIRPLVAKNYPLPDVAAAQEEFLTKKHLGKIVLIPPKT
jgi:NADPH:quinone reductase-like Zn-dependent oxidoreductase